MLTVRRGADYIRLNNEGGAPLATREFALVLGNHESRVSDTQPGPKPKSNRAHDIAFRNVCSLKTEY